jgi:GTP-binding protein
MADIPGIIKDAHKGKGLGIRFLKHIERNAVLAFVIPVDAEEPDGQYQLLREELRAYQADLASKPSLIVLTKTDLLGTNEQLVVRRIAEKLKTDVELVAVSAVARKGLEKLKRVLLRHIQESREQSAAEVKQS